MTLLVPWLALSDQRRLFPDGLDFATPEAQEAWVRRCPACAPTLTLFPDGLDFATPEAQEAWVRRRHACAPAARLTRARPACVGAVCDLLARKTE